MNNMRSTPGNTTQFAQQFELLTGFRPMRWQQRLYDEHFANGKLPSAVSMPTGLGKTAVMAIWLIALAQQMKSGQLRVPRRLVYVVDRRAVVDQATQSAEDLRANLQKDGSEDLRDAFGLSEHEAFPISTLRGQFVDNRDWLTDPSRPAIIVGTVDMIGSRLLFEGYGVSRKMRPYHAGLLGSDTLVLLDEAHLVPPFEALLVEISENAKRYGPQNEALGELIPRLQLLPLSATGRRQTLQPFTLEEKDFRHPDDAIALKRLLAKKRLTLQDQGDNKLEDILAKQAWAMAKKAEEQSNGGSGETHLKPVRIIVYCDSRQVAEKTKRALDKKAKNTAAEGRTELFVGARRVKERTDAEDRLKELGFLAGAGQQTAPSFLIATSAGEVGVDLDADHLVCDLVAWERMVQRFGRVNRRGGDNRKAQIVVVHSAPKEPKVAKPKSPKKEVLIEPKDVKKPRSPGKGNTEEYAAYLEAKKEYDAFRKAQKHYEKKKKEKQKAQQKYLEEFEVYQQAWAETFLYHKRMELLREYVKGNASPESLRLLDAQARNNKKLARLIADTSSPAPLRPALRRAVLDAWSMTSLPEHTGRPDVAPWLRGWVEEDPQITVAWRTHLPVREEPPVTSKEIEDFFEAAPIHTSETLQTETFRVMRWLKTRARLFDGQVTEQVCGLVLRADGKHLKTLRVKDLLGDSNSDKRHHEDIERSLPATILIMSAHFGGIKDGLLSDKTKDGWLSPDKENMQPPATADGDAPWMETNTAAPIIRFRIIECVEEGQADDSGMWRESLRFDLERSVDDAATRCLSIHKWRDASNTENSRAVGRPQGLTEHQCWAAQRSEEIGKRLSLPDNYIKMLGTAARLHDEGKRAANWQLAFNAARDAKKFKIDGPLAKTRGPINQALLGGYRHEFGSLRYAKDNADFRQLPDELQDLALHLVAAHHGFARPLIATKGCEDAPPSKQEERAREVALRYARLQKRWGPWGLAWWESLLRAADTQASRENDNREKN